jgi:hypothetical protein
LERKGEERSSVGDMTTMVPMQVMQEMRRKEKENKELLVKLSKKIRGQEKQHAEEAKVSLELKKRHDIMQKKLAIALRERDDSNKQMKQLVAIFTKQRKALEVSIKKNKKFEKDIEEATHKLQEKEVAY